MYKKIGIIVAITGVTLFTGWNMQQGNRNKSLSDLITLNNVEALASGESGSSNYLDYNTWYCGSGGMAGCGFPGQW